MELIFNKKKLKFLNQTVVKSSMLFNTKNLMQSCLCYDNANKAECTYARGSLKSFVPSSKVENWNGQLVVSRQPQLNA